MPTCSLTNLGSMLVNERIKIVKSLKTKKNEKYRIHITSLIPNYLKRFGFEQIGSPLKNGSLIMSLEV